MNKWELYAKNETDFPYHDIGDSVGLAEAYAKDYVDDWFKRCMEDCPAYIDQEMIDALKELKLPLNTWAQTTLWIGKWFSQFGVVTKRRGEVNGSL